MNAPINKLIILETAAFFAAYTCALAWLAAGILLDDEYSLFPVVVVVSSAVYTAVGLPYRLRDGGIR